jgi:site-specific recombinase XerD
MIYRVGISFFLKGSKVNKKGLAPLYARISVDNNRYDFSTGFAIEGNSWDAKLAIVIGEGQQAILINNYISLKKLEIQKAHNALLLDQIPVTLAAVKAKLFPKAEVQNTMLQLIKFHNATFKKRVNLDRAGATYEKYEVIYQRIEAFIRHKYNKKDLYLKDLRAEFINGFDLFLKSVVKNSQNTTAKHCQYLRSMMNFGVRHNWLEVNPFLTYKVAYKEVDRVYLTKDELANIENKSIDIKRLCIVRDLFLFQCYTGLAYADMQSLKKSDIQTGMDGEQWIFKRRKKTQQKSVIPLLAKPLQILEKYGFESKAPNDRILPKHSNQRVNSYLQEIAAICGINKKVTSHAGRRTFATTVALANGVSIETISKLLGHSSTKITSIYAVVTDSKVSEEMNKLKSRL